MQIELEPEELALLKRLLDTNFSFARLVAKVQDKIDAKVKEGDDGTKDS